jgi:hypothetical protein
MTQHRLGRTTNIKVSIIYNMLNKLPLPLPLQRNSNTTIA